jgi:hypothetical protein
MVVPRHHTWQVADVSTTSAELVSLAQEFSGRYAKRRAGPALERGEGNGGGGDAEQKKKRRSGPSSRRARPRALCLSF